MYFVLCHFTRNNVSPIIVSCFSLYNLLFFSVWISKTIHKSWIIYWLLKEESIDTFNFYWFKIFIWMNESSQSIQPWLECYCHPWNIRNCRNYTEWPGWGYTLYYSVTLHEHKLHHNQDKHCFWLFVQFIL